MTDDLSELQARLDRLSSKDRELLGHYFVQDQYGHDELDRQRILWAAEGVDVALLDLIDSIATSKEQRSRVLRLIKEGSTFEGWVESPQNADGLRDHLSVLSPTAREHLRNLLIRDHADRDATCKLYGWPQTFVEGT
jgi:hypothetical protein